MGSESVKDLRDFQGNDLYKYRVLHYNILLFFTAMSIWGSLREQLMWHLLHKLLIMFFNMGKAQLLTDVPAVLTTSSRGVSVIQGSLHGLNSF